MNYAQPSAPTRSIENHVRRLSSSRSIVALGAVLLAASGGTALAQPAATRSRPQAQSASAAGETQPSSRARAIETRTPSQEPVRGDSAPVLPLNPRPATPAVAPSRTAPHVTSKVADDAVWEARAAEAIGWVSLPDGYGGTPDTAVLVEMAQTFGWTGVPANFAAAKDDQGVAQEFGSAYPWADIANVSL